MSKKHYLLAVILFFIQKTLVAQSLALSVLPKNARKELKNFIYVNQATFINGKRFGWDSLQLHSSHKVSVNSYCINRFETTVEEFQAFYHATALPTDEPNLNVWVTEFPYAYNDPVVRNYLTNSEFSQYPIVGVTWEQAIRYCRWKTKKVNALLSKTAYEVDIRLPSENEWEMAALAIKSAESIDNERFKDIKLYPWGYDFFQKVRKGQLRFMCNGGGLSTAYDYRIFILTEDNYMYTAPVKTFTPNDFGLYQMAGNVAEWTADAYRVDSLYLQNFKESLLKDNPNALDEPFLRHQVVPKFPIKKYDDYKIVKGGSWADEPFYQQCGVRKIQLPSQASATIGFRPVCIVRKKT